MQSHCCTLKYFDICGLKNYSSAIKVSLLTVSQEKNFYQFRTGFDVIIRYPECGRLSVLQTVVSNFYNNSKSFVNGRI